MLGFCGLRITEGHFYLSYYDPNVLPRAIFISTEDTGYFKKIYQYDPFGLVSTVYVKNSPTIWAANVFDSAAGELLSAVSFYTFYPDTEYEVMSVAMECTGPVSVGTPLVYTAKVINNGSNPVTGLTLIDSLPDGVTLNSVTPGQGAFEVYDRVVVCNMGSLANGATATVIIEVTPVTRGDVTNTVSVTANEYDPDPDNNTGWPGTQDFWYALREHHYTQASFLY